MVTVVAGSLAEFHQTPELWAKIKRLHLYRDYSRFTELYHDVENNNSDAVAALLVNDELLPIGIGILYGPKTKGEYQSIGIYIQREHRRHGYGSTIMDILLMGRKTPVRMFKHDPVSTSFFQATANVSNKSWKGKNRA